MPYNQRVNIGWVIFHDVGLSWGLRLKSLLILLRIVWLNLPCFICSISVRLWLWIHRIMLWPICHSSLMKWLYVPSSALNTSCRNWHCLVILDIYIIRLTRGLPESDPICIWTFRNDRQVFLTDTFIELSKIWLSRGKRTSRLILQRYLRLF